MLAILRLLVCSFILQYHTTFSIGYNFVIPLPVSKISDCKFAIYLNFSQDGNNTNGKTDVNDGLLEAIGKRLFETGINCTVILNKGLNCCQDRDWRSELGARKKDSGVTTHFCDQDITAWNVVFLLVNATILAILLFWSISVATWHADSYLSEEGHSGEL